MINDTNKHAYDLEERTGSFGASVILICKRIPENNITKPLINQLVRSATSVGANYMEANGASSRRDFINKIYICKKESQETKHWLRMLSCCVTEALRAELNKLWQESQELTLIFQRIIMSSKKSVVRA